MEQKATPIKRMATPTFVVNKADYERLAYENIMVYEVHGRRGLKLVPPMAQECGENKVIFPEAPKEIIFRKRFSFRKCRRKVRFITADNSQRYDLVFTITLK